MKIGDWFSHEKPIIKTFKLSWSKVFPQELLESCTTCSFILIEWIKFSIVRTYICTYILANLSDSLYPSIFECSYIHPVTILLFLPRILSDTMYSKTVIKFLSGEFSALSAENVNCFIIVAQLNIFRCTLFIHFHLEYRSIFSKTGIESHSRLVDYVPGLKKISISVNKFVYSLSMGITRLYTIFLFFTIISTYINWYTITIYLIHPFRFRLQRHHHFLRNKLFIMVLRSLWYSKKIWWLFVTPYFVKTVN